MSTYNRGRVPTQYVDKDFALAEYDRVLSEQRGPRNAALGNTIGNVLGNTATMGLGLNPLVDMIVGYGVGEIGSKIGAGDTDKRIAERMAATGYEGDTEQRHRAGANLMAAAVPNMVGPLGLPLAAIALRQAVKKGWIRPEADSTRAKTIIASLPKVPKVYEAAKAGDSVLDKILKSRVLYDMAHPSKRTLYTGLGLGAGLSLAAGLPLAKYLERKGYERNRARIAQGIDEQNARFEAAGQVYPKTSSMHKESIIRAAMSAAGMVPGGAIAAARMGKLFPAVRAGRISPHATGMKMLPMVADAALFKGPAVAFASMAAGASPMHAAGLYGATVGADALATYMAARAGAMARAGIKPSATVARYTQPIANAAKRAQTAFNASPARHIVRPFQAVGRGIETAVGKTWQGVKNVADKAVNSRYGVQRVSPRLASTLNNNPLTRSLKMINVDETVGMAPSLAKNSQLDRALLAAYSRANDYVR